MVASLLKPPREAKDGNRSPYSSPPTIIVTSDAANTLLAMKKYGVDVSNWEIGLTSLFDCRVPSARLLPSANHTSEERKTSPGRSGSPPRFGELSESRERKRTSDTSRVHVVDLQDIWHPLAVVADIAVGNKPIREMALRLGISCDPQKWSAGNDVEYGRSHVSCFVVDF